MDNFEKESRIFDEEVRKRAAYLIKTGQATPYEAIKMATEQIMSLRKYTEDTKSLPGYTGMAGH